MPVLLRKTPKAAHIIDIFQPLKLKSCKICNVKVQTAWDALRTKPTTKTEVLNFFTKTLLTLRRGVPGGTRKNRGCCLASTWNSAFSSVSVYSSASQVAWSPVHLSCKRQDTQATGRHEACACSLALRDRQGWLLLLSRPCSTMPRLHYSLFRRFIIPSSDLDKMKI
ncbi:hypothetical protein C8J56DRAFT_262588 [Mycena floridula]|nr:hypothetical protein C8J56DRAFT_262588 [Mycena floridula]